MSRWLRNLNAEQRRAASIVEGPLLVLAGAGSGKTRVITHRIAHMLELGIAPEHVLAVTFTNKAAAEMRERLGKMVGHRRASDVTLSTFHSLGLQMLKVEGARERRRGRGRFVIFDAGDQTACLRELSSRLSFGRSFDWGSVLARISAYKNAFLDADDERVLADAADDDDPYAQAAGQLYGKYVEQMQAYAAVDFDDLIVKPTRLLEDDKAARERWRKRYRYLLVDEFQDTNGAQLRLLEALCGPTRNLCVVGDDDQAIYGWRGADVKNILSFDKRFSGAEVVYLTKNYRSVPSVLSLANRVIAQNPHRHDKSLEATRPAGPNVRMVVAPDGDAEAAWVARSIATAIRKKRYRARDIAVLYRSSILSRAIELSLREQGVRYRVLGGALLFERKEVKDLAAYLRLLVNPADEISLRRVINWPARGVGPRTLAKLSSWADDHDQSLYSAMKKAAVVLGPSDRAVKPIEQLVGLLGRCAGQARGGTRAMAQVARELIGEVGLRAELQRSSTSSSQFDRRWGNIQAFIAALDSYCQRAEKPSMLEFLTRMALVSGDEDPEQASADQVTLSTLHGAKGLEFPYVLMVGLEDGIIPHRRTLEPRANDPTVAEGKRDGTPAAADLSEERRLLYVGITRAMDELVLTRAEKRLLRGKLVDRPQTRFLEGLEEDHLAMDDLSAPPPMDDVRAMMSELRARFGGEPAGAGAAGAGAAGATK